MSRTLVAALGMLTALAQAAPAHAATGQAAALKHALGAGVRVAAGRDTGLVRFVGAAAGDAMPSGTRPSASPREAARAFLARHRTAFGIADAGRELRVESSRATGGGRTSVRFRQLRGGIPVLGGEVVVNVERDRRVLSVTSELEPGGVDPTPAVTPGLARLSGVAAVAKHRRVSAARLTATTPRLWVYDARLLGGPGPRRPTLVWRVDVEGDSGAAIDDLVLVDAVHGNVALRIAQAEEALNRAVCDAASAKLLTCLLPARSEGGPPTGIADVDLAYDRLKDGYDFYASRFGRDGVDGKGMKMAGIVRYCPTAASCPWNNAAWYQHQLILGEGWPRGDDAIGHELTHGVTESSANLFYYFQSGAINESMSDVFGELIDLTNGTGSDTPADRWLVFEDVPGGPLRNMKDPTAAPGKQADRMTSPLYSSDANETDNGGVHANSGVGNKAAYLMTDGGTFNGRTVTGLGIPKVARMFYNALTTKLTSGSDYADLGTALPQACDELVGTGGITTADCTEVRDAVAAVEMTANPTAAPAPHAPAATCPSGHVRTDLLEDGMDVPANWLRTGAWQFSDAYAHSESSSLFGADGATRGDSAATMAGGVHLPEHATSYLRFDHAYGFDDDVAGTAFDGGVLEVSVNGGPFADIGSRLTDVGYTGTISAASDNPLAGREAFVGESNGYRASRATLTSLAGDTVRFRWRIGTDTGVGGVGWYLDDVHIYSCAPPPPDPTPDPTTDPTPEPTTDPTPDPTTDPTPDPTTDPTPDPTTHPSPEPTTDPTPEPTASGGVLLTPSDPFGPISPPSATFPFSNGEAAKLTLASVSVRWCNRSRRGRGRGVRCVMRRYGAVRRAIVMVRLRGRMVAGRTLRLREGGVVTLTSRRVLRHGTYKVTIVLRDAAGRERTLRTAFRVR